MAISSSTSGLPSTCEELVGDAKDDAERGTEEGQAEDGGDHVSIPLRRSDRKSP